MAAGLLYLFHGEDDFSKRLAVAEFAAGLGGSDSLVSSTSVLEARGLTLEELTGACATVPFLAEKRLVVITGLVERFAGASKGGRKKRGQTARNGNPGREFLDCLINTPDFCIVVLLEEKINPKSAWFTELAGHADVRAFPPLKGVRLRQWIEDRVAASGGCISSPAVDLLAQTGGSDLWSLVGEIEKLELYAWERRIEVADVESLVSHTRETSVFAMVDAVLAGRHGVAAKQMEQLLDGGSPPLQLLAMLGRQLRMVLRIKALTGQGRMPAAIGERLGITSRFVLNKALEQAQSCSLPQLKNFYRRLLAADIAIKTGKQDERMALTLLVADLSLSLV